MDNEKKLEVLAQKESELTQIANSFVIENEATLTLAGGFLVAVKNLASQVIDTFKEPKDAAWKTHKAITAAEKKHLDPLKAAEDIVKAKVNKYVTAREAAKRKAAEEAQAALAVTLEESGNVEMAESVRAQPMAVTEAPKVAGLTMRKEFKYRVVNYKLIPDDYWILNDDLVGGIVKKKGLDAMAEIPGIEVYEESAVSVRRGS